MKLPLSIILFCLLLIGCKKEEIIQDPRFQKFQGHWRGYSGTQQNDITLKKNGIVDVQYENERGRRFRIDEIRETMTSQPVMGKNMRIYSFRNNYKKGYTQGVSFFEDTANGAIYGYHQFITDGVDFIDTNILFKLEKL